MEKRPGHRTRVFLNLPYDSQFHNLYLAYLAGIYAFGMYPRVTLEIPGGARRLDRILRLIGECKCSIHDLSRVQLDRAAPRTPRFNMPFELGLAVALDKAGGKSSGSFFVMESVPYRLSKSLSDMNGTDPHIHGGTVRGVFREIGNAFVRPGLRPSVRRMQRIYRELKRELPRILRVSGAKSVFEARVFQELGIVASAAAGAFVE